ncbi:hypothetical protein ARMSODRAFT_1023765 [Armillaria solidipes]|uniref:Uncharacterized protein n=1 Tax=Armillaria solidipes TaxID=1076256 RepID=A0A2H3BKH9_9AGAR|nr:hypothetical protein ARMSODRAFT_1023765 [Armillaria solidipes]
MHLTLHFTEDQIGFLCKSLSDFLHEAEEFKKQFVLLLSFKFVHWWPESMDKEEEHAGMPSKATVQCIMMAMCQLDFEQTPYILLSTHHAQHQRATRECLAEQAHIAQAAVYWKRAARDGQDTERCFMLLFLQEHLKLFQIPLQTGLSLAKATALKKLLLVRHLQWSYWTSPTIARLADASEELPYPGPYNTRGQQLCTLYKHAQQEAASEWEVTALNRLHQMHAGPSTLHKKKTGNIYALQEYYEAEYECLMVEDEQWALAHGLASTVK